jgi:NTE family protein
MFRSIAFGGGGMRGALHLGGLRALLNFQESLVFPDGIYGYSIGSVIATALAFHMSVEQIQEMIDDAMNLEAVLRDAKLSMFTDLFDKCGLISMDQVESSIVNVFLKHGVDLRGKQIADAPQKLFIGASNLTLRKPVFFTGKVPILAAIKASCCIPCFFQPQVIYDNVYIDGGVHMYYFDEYLPKDCVSFIVTYTPTSIRPQDLQGNLLELVKQLYCGQRHPPTSPYAIWFKEDKVHILHDITSNDKTRLVRNGYSQVFSFLTKRLAQEGKH